MKRYLKKMITCMMVMVMVVTMTGAVNAGNAIIGGEYEGFYYNGQLRLTTTWAGASMAITPQDGAAVIPEENYFPNIRGSVVDEDGAHLYTIITGDVASASCNWGKDVTGDGATKAIAKFFMKYHQVAQEEVMVN